MKYLITNADDCGWGADITQGIIDAHIKGILSSASVIVNEIDQASIDLIKTVPKLGRGLHLNIATGEPLTTSWKSSYGSFTHPRRPKADRPYLQSMWNEMYQRFDSKIIYQEFEAQLEKFKELFGKLPDHLDTHYNTYSVKNVFYAFLELAVNYSLPVRHPVGYNGDSDNQNFTTKTSEIVLIPEFLAMLHKNNVLTTTYFSLEYINLHEDIIDAFSQELDKIKDKQSIEISFHPGYREEWRQKQVQILTDDRLQKWLKEHNVKVINYSQLHEYCLS